MTFHEELMAAAARQGKPVGHPCPGCAVEPYTPAELAAAAMRGAAVTPQPARRSLGEGGSDAGCLSCEASCEALCELTCTTVAEVPR